MIPRLFLLACSLALVACVPVPTPPVVSLQGAPSADLEPLKPGEGSARLHRTYLEPRASPAQEDRRTQVSLTIGPASL
jgi:hypothetical protein